MTTSVLRSRIDQAAMALQVSQEQRSHTAKVHKLTCSILGDSQWDALKDGGNLGLESLSNERIVRNGSFDVNRADVDGLIAGLRDEINIPSRHISSVAEQCMTHLDQKFDSKSILHGGQFVADKHSNLSMVVGRTASSRYSVDGGAGMEAFGDDINRIAADDRLTMDLIIMRPAENIMDKALARVSSPSPVVTIKVPDPQAFDWAKTQEANSTVESRYGASNTYRYRDMFRNPTPVNSAPKRITAKSANDSGSFLWNSTTLYYATAKKVPLLDLSRDDTNFTYDSIDRSDLVSDGAFVDGVIFSLKSGATTEYFKIDTSVMDLNMFVPAPSSKDSGTRQMSMEVVFPINEATKTWNGSTSTLTAELTDAKIRATVNFHGDLNLKTGVVNSSGTIELTLLQLADGTTISTETNTFFGGLTAAVVGYSVDARFDEENMRKANLSLTVNYYQLQFVVPRGRMYFTDYSLSQDIDENAIAFTSSVVALGNGRRGLDTIVDSLNDVASAQKFASENPEIASYNTLSEQSLAGSLVKPTVVTTTINFEDENVNNMNESTLLQELHGRFRARLLMMAADLFAKSLMLNQYKAGEKPVLKAWVHSSIADIVIGIVDYYPELNDRESVASGADYSMLLPNGYRLDVIKTNFDCMQNRCYIIPVVETDMTGIVSGAHIEDCGTFSANYIPTFNGASVRRFATTSREIVMVTNRVGLCIEVVGIQAKLGTIGHNPLLLGDAITEDLSV